MKIKPPIPTLMLDGEIMASEYIEMKIEIDETIKVLSIDEVRIKEGFENYESKIDKCLELLATLDDYYKERTITTKQRIIGSIFPEKLVFENENYRTPQLNEAVELICRKDKCFGKRRVKKKSIPFLICL